jgi:hypothetical protein
VVVAKVRFWEILRSATFAPRATAAVLIVVAACYMPMQEIVHSHIPGALG